MYFLDTNICIHFLNGSAPSIKENLLSKPVKEIKIPVIVQSELLFGAYKSARKKENLQKLERFLEPFEVISFVPRMSEIYATIRFDTESKGEVVGPNDLLIAAIVLAHGGTLVTRNTHEFSRIHPLKITEW